MMYILVWTYNDLNWTKLIFSGIFVKFINPIQFACKTYHPLLECWVIWKIVVELTVHCNLPHLPQETKIDMFKNPESSSFWDLTSKFCDLKIYKKNFFVKLEKDVYK